MSSKELKGALETVEVKGELVKVKIIGNIISTGPQGLTGEKGDTGPQGLTGEKVTTEATFDYIAYGKWK